MVAVRRRTGLKGSNLDADSSNNLYVRAAESDNYVWDTGSLTWVKMTQPGAAAGGLTDAELRASAVPVVEQGTASTLNSSTALLGISGVFTGTFEDMRDYGAVVITFNADVGFAFNGIQWQWSPDGVNADVTESTNQAFAGVGESRVTQVKGRYFRMVVTNGAVGQASFRLNTHYKRVAEVPSPLGAVQLLDQAGVKKALIDAGGDADAVQNRLYVDSMPRMYNGATFDRMRGDTTNGLDVDVTRLPTLANVTTVGTVTTVTTVSTVTSLTQMNGAAIAMNTGTRSAGTQRVTIATDDLVPVTLASTTLTATVNPAGMGTAVSGRQVVTTAGTAVQFTSQVCKVVAITAETDNTGLIVLGDAAVVAAIATRKGTPLSAGDTAICAVSNMNLLYQDSTVNGDGVTWLVLS